MFDQCNNALRTYFDNWQALREKVHNKAVFETLKPVAVGWKVADKAEYQKLCEQFHDQCDMIVEKWMNGRWIAQLHLKDTTLEQGITIIKIMERRPGSTDAVGLDHVDFYSPEVTNDLLESETELTWTLEENDVLDDYTWQSIWFADTEAKLKASTVIDNATTELQIINDQVKNS